MYKTSEVVQLIHFCYRLNDSEHSNQVIYYQVVKHSMTTIRTNNMHDLAAFYQLQQQVRTMNNIVLVWSNIAFLGRYSI